MTSRNYKREIRSKSQLVRELFEVTTVKCSSLEFQFILDVKAFRAC